MALDYDDHAMMDEGLRQVARAVRSLDKPTGLHRITVHATRTHDEHRAPVEPVNGATLSGVFVGSYEDTVHYLSALVEALEGRGFRCATGIVQVTR